MANRTFDSNAFEDAIAAVKTRVFEHIPETTPDETWARAFVQAGFDTASIRGVVDIAKFANDGGLPDPFSLGLLVGIELERRRTDG